MKTLDLLFKMQAKCQPQMILFCQVLHRHPSNMNNKYVNKPIQSYNTEVDSFNHEMISILQPLESMAFWKHKGFLHTEVPYTTDGVHPNTSSGKKKYRRSVTAAVRWGLNLSQHGLPVMRKRSRGKKSRSRKRNYRQHPY